MIWLLLMVLVLVGLFVWAFATAEMAPELRQRYAALRSTPEPKRETETAPVTLQQELERLPADIAADFGCPGRGPHAWTSATIPHVSAQYCRHCPARKPIPGRVDPLGVPEPESEPAPVTLEQRLEWLPADIVADFGCPSRGPHE